MAKNPEESADARTKGLIRTLRKHNFSDLAPGQYLGRGASALVFKCAVRDGFVALKVFDPDFIKEHQAEIERERLDRQLELRNHGHPNLVEILGGGVNGSLNTPFLIMAYYDAPSLEDLVPTFPKQHIRRTIAQLASAARHLETLKWVHRDIKPANIVVINNFERAVLLDLGVVRPLGLSRLTDSSETKEFVGTTRYSPPEFLLRTEENTEEAWRAVTFYQLGAVLHDLIVERPIFHDKHPKGRLYQAIFMEPPRLEGVSPGDAVLQDLIRLARLCLQKLPGERIATVTWEMFSESYAPPTTEELRSRILSLRTARMTGPNRRADAEPKNEYDLSALALSIKDGLLSDNVLFPSHSFHVDSSTRSITFTLDPSTQHMIEKPIYVTFRIDDVMTTKSTYRFRASAVKSSRPPIVRDKESFVTFEIPKEESPLSYALRCMTGALLAAAESNGREDDDTLWLGLDAYL